MKIINQIFFILLICAVLPLQAQIEILGANDGMNESAYRSKPFYAIKDIANTQPFGQILFTPVEGGSGWEYDWEYNGTSQPVTYTDDSSYLFVDISGNGFYTFHARRNGHISSVIPEFYIFFDHVPSFTISLSDIYNCEAITIDPLTDFIIPVYKEENMEYEGNLNVEYLLSGNTTPWTFNNYNYALMSKSASVSVEDRSLTVEITDRFGFQWTSGQVEYKSVIPDAKMTLKFLNDVKVEGMGGADVGQAPLEVEFRDESINAQQWEWYLYKDTADLARPLSNLEDSLLNEMIRTQKDFNYIYENTGRYMVKLKAINSNGLNHCWDTTEIQYVNVIASLIRVPNVFTPNGDGKNDIFRAQVLSVESFKGVILNRWGRIVYEWNNPEEGWNGRINGKYANPGTYFYVITARGREKTDPPKYVQKGPLLLVR